MTAATKVFLFFRVLRRLLWSSRKWLRSRTSHPWWLSSQPQSRYPCNSNRNIWRDNSPHQLHAGSSFTAFFRTFNRTTVTFFIPRVNGATLWARGASSSGLQCVQIIAAFYIDFHCCSPNTRIPWPCACLRMLGICFVAKDPKAITCSFCPSVTIKCCLWNQ